MSVKQQSRGWIWIIIACAIVVVGIWSLKTIRFQTELYPLFPQDLPSVQGLKTFQHQFATAQELFLVIQPKSSPEFLQNQWKPLKQALESEASVERVRLWEVDPALIHELIAWQISNLPIDQFQEFQGLFKKEMLRERLAESKRLLAGSPDEELIFRLQADPFRFSEWLSEKKILNLSTSSLSNLTESRTLVVRIRPKQILKNFEQCQDFVRTVRGILARHQGEGVSYYLTGRPAFVAEESVRMKHDMQMMITIAVGFVALTFWLFYRSILPLVWILLLQGIGMLSGVIGARLLFGELNVLSIAFGAILLGVGMDYCILVYHYFATGKNDPKVWSVLCRGIHLSAITTAASFSILAFSSFPGFRQLAVLISLGLIVIGIFATEALPLVLECFTLRLPTWISRVSIQSARWITLRRSILMVLCLSGIAIAAGAFFLKEYRFYDSDLTRFRNTGSEAAKGMQLLAEAHPDHSSSSIIISGSEGKPIDFQLQGLDAHVDEQAFKLIETCLRERNIGNDTLPPPRNQAGWGKENQRLVQETLQQAGFASPWGSSSLQVVQLLDQWSHGRANFSSIQEMMKDFVQEENGRITVRIPLKRSDNPEKQMQEVLGVRKDVLPASWRYMGSELNRTAQSDFKRLSIWMFIAIVVLCAWAHRSVRQVLMNLGALGVALLLFLILLFVMGQTITVFSLLSIPLLIGLIIDYSLHMLLALEAEEGDLTSVFQHLAVPIFLTGLTSVIGFGAPLASQQESLRNFGMVMDLGIISAVFTALVWIPAFYPRRNSEGSLDYARDDRKGRDCHSERSRGISLQSGPSRTLYRAFWFDVASWIVQQTSRSFVGKLGRACGWFYYLSHPLARENVRANRSLLNKDVSDDEIKQTFLQYGENLADYFCLGNRPKNEVLSYVGEVNGSRILQSAHAEGKGVLIVTTHLSLFEYGGVWIREWNMPFTVVSLAEPSEALTDWRASYRKRWGADTLIVGEDEFSFLSITKRLNEGGVVAVLIDRPQTDKAVTIDLPYGQTRFSTGPVLISLLSGCPIVPTTVVRLPDRKYQLQVFEPIRPQWLPEGKEWTLEFFTKELAKVFIPSIQKHSDQWFHFVPIQRK
jgi:uncharacterized protein